MRGFWRFVYADPAVTIEPQTIGIAVDLPTPSLSPGEVVLSLQPVEVVTDTITVTLQAVQNVTLNLSPIEVVIGVRALTISGSPEGVGLVWLLPERETSWQLPLRSTIWVLPGRS